MVKPLALEKYPNTYLASFVLLQTLMNWYKELHKKTSEEPEACLTIINWKAL